LHIGHNKTKCKNIQKSQNELRVNITVVHQTRRSVGFRTTQKLFPLFPTRNRKTQRSFII